MTSPFEPIEVGTKVEFKGRELTVVHDRGGMMVLLEDEDGRKFAPLRNKITVKAVQAD